MLNVQPVIAKNPNNQPIFKGNDNYRNVIDLEEGRDYFDVNDRADEIEQYLLEEQEYNDNKTFFEEKQKELNELVDKMPKKAKGTVQALSVGITMVLSGLAAHWGSKQTMKIMGDIYNNPKVQNFVAKSKNMLSEASAPIGAAFKSGKDAFKAKAGELKFVNNIADNKFAKKVSKFYSDLADTKAGQKFKGIIDTAKNIKAKEAQNGIAGFFGVSGAAAGGINELKNQGILLQNTEKYERELSEESSV